MFGHGACRHTEWNKIGILTVSLHNLFHIWWKFPWIILVCNSGYVPRHFGGVKEQRRKAKGFEVEWHVRFFVLSFDCACFVKASEALVCLSVTCNYCGKATSNKWMFSFDQKKWWNMWPFWCILGLSSSTAADQTLMNPTDNSDPWYKVVLRKNHWFHW